MSQVDCMYEIQLHLDNEKQGAFVVYEEQQKMAEMEIGISGNELIVYHTEVHSKLFNYGIRKKLLLALADYAIQHQLKVVPFCSYVHSEFRKAPHQYAHIWNSSTGL